MYTWFVSAAVSYVQYSYGSCIAYGQFVCFFESLVYFLRLFSVLQVVVWKDFFPK